MAAMYLAEPGSTGACEMSSLNGLLAGKIGHEYSRGAVPDAAVADPPGRDGAGAGARADALATSTPLVATAAIHPARWARTRTILRPAAHLRACCSSCVRPRRSR